ncbi:MAG: 30S ribosomal protein S16 [Bacilli bacterium]|jgi:small subunit ribosomal protein S16|nr:30S ribosomal protein S16 [Bacilli bacterium]MCH4202378.1 30S ribosomal protein S16 [Bacilli bacterium]MCH4236111.1 30S ribosomal protein S16 [Bacilli bacterium]HMM01224.1 30S ribosomal protein S16 [Bacilli bacterium]
MSVKLRLTRVGRHDDPFYRIVAADSRMSRDGRFIEQIGHYDPNKALNGAVIDEAAAIKWLQAGAQPSGTVKAILTKAGIVAKFNTLKKEGK